MNTIVIGSELREKLLAADGIAELRDEAGNIIGHYVPSGPPAPPPGYVIEGEWPSDEELDRREREGKFVSSAQVVAFLAGLKKGATAGSKP